MTSPSGSVSRTLHPLPCLLHPWLPPPPVGRRSADGRGRCQCYSELPPHNPKKTCRTASSRCSSSSVTMAPPTSCSPPPSASQTICDSKSYTKSVEGGALMLTSHLTSSKTLPSPRISPPLPQMCLGTTLQRLSFLGCLAHKVGTCL
jgi:hypothetical protein